MIGIDGDDIVELGNRPKGAVEMMVTWVLVDGIVSSKPLKVRINNTLTPQVEVKQVYVINGQFLGQFLRSRKTLSISLHWCTFSLARVQHLAEPLPKRGVSSNLSSQQ